MTATIIPLLPRQRAVDARRAYGRQGMELKYRRGEGVKTLTCDTCRFPIIYGRCKCPPVRA